MRNNQCSMFQLRTVLLFASGFLMASCSVQKQISKAARGLVLNDTALATAHVGISIFDTEANKYLYNYQGDRYFVPASNIKIPTCYAAMKYLGDSLVSGRLSIDDKGSLLVFPAGDPTFLNNEFSFQPLLEEMKKHKNIRWNTTDWKEQRWGSGWAWNDYESAYMAERSPFPVYGNIINFHLSGDTLTGFPNPLDIWFSQLNDSLSIYNQKTKTVKSNKFILERRLDNNIVFIIPSKSSFTNMQLPFRTDVEFVSKLLEDTIKAGNVSTFAMAVGTNDNPKKQTIHSQPTDSLLKPMMHRSDNFFAEQTLLMVSHKVLGVMSDARITDTILKTDFKDLPQKPRWVDGSGLSRYNLFTPQDFVVILNKMRNEFGMKRIKDIFATGGEGTISSYYKRDSSFIYAKTGTLSGVVAISGFLYTSKKKLLLFSVLVNNHQASATGVRRAVEKFIQGIRRKY